MISDFDYRLSTAGAGLFCLLTGLTCAESVAALEINDIENDIEQASAEFDETNTAALLISDRPAAQANHSTALGVLASNLDESSPSPPRLSDGTVSDLDISEFELVDRSIPNDIDFSNVDWVTSSAIDTPEPAAVRSPSTSDSLTTDSSASSSTFNTTVSSNPSTESLSVVQSSTNESEPITSVSQLAANESLGQVTSVSQLSDVQPTDWAFQALQSLVERYGCIAGYPDGTYRGNRALSRYEFAAGLNACLDRVSELIAAGLADTVTRDDLATLQRLQEEFAAELATLRGRVDALEARTAELEANQFSTTTKLNGEVVFSVAGATGGVDDNDAQVVFNNRVRLNLTTSFTGNDLLITGLQAYNFGGGFDDPTGSIPGTLGLGDPVFGTASNVSLGTAPQFGRTNPSDLSSRGANDIALYKLLYIFPVADQFTMFVGSNVEVTDAFPAIAPFANDSQGAISRFATVNNAATRVSGGTSGIGLASAAGFIWSISDDIDLRGLYASVNAAVVENNGLLSTDPTPLGAGLFGGSYVISSQLTATPTDTLTLGLNYANSYHQINILGTGLSASDIGSVLFNPNADQLAKTGGNAVLAVLDEGIRLNSVGATVNWQFAPKVDLTLSGGYIFADLVDVDASTNFISWLVGLHFRDVFGEGNTAALIFGQPLNRDSTGGDAFNPEDADPYQLEAYFNVRVNDNISITPGVFAVFNPEGFSSNDTAITGVLRTTFTF
ncbi:MAG TPA: iron uptake porin [Elainellaceae cyanobacterium]